MKLPTSLTRKGAATSDAVLLQEASAGSAASLATLYDRYESKVFNFCLRLTGSREDAADATQEAFLGVLRKLKTDDAPVLNFSAYLFTAARHESYRLSRRRERSYPSAELPERRDAADELSALEGDPERSAMAKSSQEEIRAANGRLPPRYREVLALHDLEGASYAEIGDIMGMRGNAVAQLIFRARKRLRSELKAGAVASFIAVSADCRRAQELISMREDGELHDRADNEWLDRHLDECGSCRASRAALLEVGAAYGAWLPAAVVVGLREDVLARGSELIGADWMADPAAWHDGAPNAGASSDGASNGGAANGSTPHGGDSSARFVAGAAGTAAVGLGIIALLTLPADDPPPAAAKREASEARAAQAAAEPSRRGSAANGPRAADAESSSHPGRPARGAGPPDPRPVSFRRRAGTDERSARGPTEQVSPRGDRPPAEQRRQVPRENATPGGPPVSENSPGPETPPVGPPPVPQVEEGSPSPACTHPWKPSESKPCPPGHDESGDDDDRDEDDDDRDDNRDRDRDDDD